MDTSEYHRSSLVKDGRPFSGAMVKANGVLCADGVRRNAFPSHDGVADTFFSIPAYVYCKGKRIYGYVTIETMAGFTTPTEDDPATVKFVAFTERKHSHLIDPKKLLKFKTTSTDKWGRVWEIANIEACVECGQPAKDNCDHTKIP